MKKILCLSMVLLLCSCYSSGQGWGRFERTLQLIEFHHQKVQEIKNRSLYQKTKNGTELLYAHNRSTVRWLEWEDTRLENREGYVWIYARRRNDWILEKKIRKGVHSAYKRKVRVRDPYEGSIDLLNLEIVTIPGNVFIYLKQGLVRVEDYSMR